MPIFQKSILNKYLKNLDNEKVNLAFKQFQRFYGNKLRLFDIVHLKEENYQEGFLREVFVQSLGYTIRPDLNYNLTTEYKNQTDSKKADGAIIINNSAIGVIELKSAKTFNLDTIKNQAFNYKHNQPDCRYVITSNFHYLRFYIDNSAEYEEFDLFEITEKEFQYFYLILSHDSIFNDIPLKMKEETKFHEESISDKFYRDYKTFKDKVFENFVLNNPQYDKLIWFKKSQKLLDRFIFVWFAEDCGLVAPNAIQKMIDQYHQYIKLEDYKTLYSRFQLLFHYLDKGYKSKVNKDVYWPPYNGGLFKYDEIIDSEEIKLDDNILLEFCPKISTYDFNTEIDVNILGHIFEHSLNEIEEITAELKGETIEKSKTKRKKDGIFYTPKYITNYIVENTIGKLCREKQSELQIFEIELNETYNKNKKITKQGKELYQILQNYKNWLLTLKILDPACGSGAFLNSALDFLISEHQRIDDLVSDLTGDKIRMFDTDKTILENNIFGVDINEESVEIAKLSLWLRTAKKDRVLSDLNNNIKCGNSLIDNKEIAKEKAFNWNLEFPEIMQNGGFDIIIGNPPYVKARDNNDTISRKFIESAFVTTYKMWDLYVPFIEKGCNLIKNTGLVSMIIPDTIGISDYTQKLVNFIETNCNLYQIDFFPDIYVFKNVGVKSKIIYISKIKKDDLQRIAHIGTLENIINLPKVENSDKYIYKIADFNINLENTIPLMDICFVSYGLRLNSDKEDIDKFKKDDLLSKVQTEKYIKKFTEGKHIERYKIEKELFLEWGTERCPKKLVRATFPELYTPEKLLLSRQKKIATYSNEGHICDNTIIVALLAKDLKEIKNSSISKYYQNIKKDRKEIENFSSNFDLKYILAIINSKLFEYYIKFQSKGKIDFYPDDWKRIPIKNIDFKLQQIFTEKAVLLLNLNKEIHNEKYNFINSLKEDKKPKQINSKIENFQKIDFDEFKLELTKQNVKFSLGEDNNQWRNYFSTTKEKIINLQNAINNTDNEINRMVYELYELSNADIELVEKKDEV